MKKENDLPKFTFLKNCLLGRHVVDLRKPLIPLGFLWPFVPHVNSKNPWSVRTSFRSSFTAASRSWKFHMVHLKISPWKRKSLLEKITCSGSMLNLGGGNLSKKSMCLLFCFLLVCSSTILWRQQTLMAKSGKLDDVHIFLVSKGMILAIQTGQ